MRMTVKKTLCFLCACLCVIFCAAPTLTGCTPASPDRDPASDGKLIVACTSYPASEFTKALLDGAVAPLTADEQAATGNFGDAFEIVFLCNKSGDMHGFEPSTADVRNLARADVLVCVGGESEAWVASAVAACGNPGLKVIRMMDLVDVVEEEAPEGAETEAEDEHGTEVEYDEHVWTSIKNDMVIVDAIADVLGSVYPQGADRIADNAAAYKAELSRLDTAYADMVSTAARRELLIADRYPFVYLMRDYGLTCWAAFPGCSAETQASFSTQIFLVEKVKELTLPAIFTVDNGAGSVASTISKETGAQVLRLWSGQTFPDGDVTYLDMLEENLRNLRTALN